MRSDSLLSIGRSRAASDQAKALRRSHGAAWPVVGELDGADSVGTHAGSASIVSAMRRCRDAASPGRRSSRTASRAGRDGTGSRSVDDDQLGVDGFAQPGVELGIVEVAGPRSGRVRRCSRRRRAGARRLGAPSDSKRTISTSRSPAGRSATVGAGRAPRRRTGCRRCAGRPPRRTPASGGRGRAVEHRRQRRRCRAGARVDSVTWGSRCISARNGQRVAAVQLVAAVGGDDEHGGIGEGAGHEGDQVPSEASAQWMSSRTTTSGSAAAASLEHLGDGLEQAQLSSSAPAPFSGSGSRLPERAAPGPAHSRPGVVADLLARGRAGRR